MIKKGELSMPKSRRNLIIITCLIAAIATAGIFVSCSKSADKGKKVIGVNQYMEHPLLDEARKGMMDELNRQGITEANGFSIVYRNAGGDQPTAVQINSQFVNQKVAMIVALGTPSAQSAVKATQTIPIVFGVITDPVASGLAESESAPGGNKTGTSDRWPYEKQIGLIRQILPNAKKVGIVLNPSESNTEASMKYIRPLLTANGMEAIEVPVANSSEVIQAAKSLVGRCDVFLVPGDNTVIAAISSMVKVAEENDIPLFAGDEDSVKKGAIATYGNNYYKVGVATGRIIAKIFKENISNVGSVPVAVATEADLIINLKAAQEQGVQIPESLINQAKTVIK
jgi:putative ABC transport system substrate-binding protein